VVPQMMTNDQQPPTLLTERQAALRLGVTIYCLRKWRARKIGPSYVKLSDNIASGVRYDAHDLEGWIEGRKQHPQTRS
jgi:hypothetical protein